MNNGPTFTSLSSSSSQSTDDSLYDRLSSKSNLTNTTGFFQRFIALGRQYSSQKNNIDASNDQLTFIVHFLDDSERIIIVDRHSDGSDLMEKVFDFNEEREFFGLLIDESTYQWLDPNKALRKQFPNIFSPIHLEVKVRFFPTDPANDLKNNFTKYLFVQHLKREIANGKLPCPTGVAARLASFLVQNELGDFRPDEHRKNYLSDFHFLPIQDAEFERQLEQFHKENRGQTPFQTEENYLQLASALDFYGLELHNVSVKVSNPNSEFSQSIVNLQLAIGAAGLLVFHNSKKVNAFAWNRITKISFKRRIFSIQLAQNSGSAEENLIVFTAPNRYCCKYLWKSCVDHHTFFRSFSMQKVRLAENGAETTSKKSSNRMDMNDSERYLDNLPSAAMLFPPVSDDSSSIRVVQLQPNLDGRYGFNIRVDFSTDSRRTGIGLVADDDKSRSIVIAKVIENTPASQADLHEGDLLIAVNQVDIEQMTRDEVIEMIRESRQSFQGNLELWIKPVKTDDAQEKQKHSIAILRDDLETMRFIEQYNSLPRRDEKATFHAATRAENAPFNRYRDVLPYDKTRVVLQTDPNTDYINANHIEIPIRSRETVNRYIATQGPLLGTCSSFWRMIWEQNCHLILMLTPLIESNRIKCHQYWPELSQTNSYSCFTVHCREEREENDFIYREFVLCNETLSQERVIYHIQNHLWPDHGVPNDCRSFLECLMKIRNLRKIKPDSPVLVHCSAGIGRTGVFILIETGLCLIEENQTIFPLDIVRQMREQRMGMIQTASQYQFGCQTILFAYDQKLIDR